MDDLFDIISSQQAIDIAQKFGTPVYAYNEGILEKHAQETLAFPHAFGLTVRYAMKAAPTKKIIQIFDNLGLHIDASSWYEVQRARRAGIRPQNIQLTAQELPATHDLKNMMHEGIRINACSLHQLETIGSVALSPRPEISLRINPGIGSGSTRKTNVGGPASSFGIWHEQLADAKKLADQCKLAVTRLHSHIGSGSNPDVYKRAASLTLNLVKEFPNVKTVNLGGGFKVARMPKEEETNLQECGLAIKEEFVRFFAETGRQLHLEIEPGTYLVANASVVVTKIIDVKSTGKYSFLLVNSGMTEVTRPALYAAQHPLDVVQMTEGPRQENKYIVAGHCCESGDIWTPAVGAPDGLRPRLLPSAYIGDLLIIGGAGAYCSSMSTKNYNSFPEAEEVLIGKNGELKRIRARQSMDQIIANER